jgi:hypothetical protein
VESGIDLNHAKAQRGGNAKNCAQYRKNVDGMADGAVDAIANQRIQRRTDGQR